MKTFTILDLRTVLSKKRAHILTQTLRTSFPNLSEKFVTTLGKNMYGAHEKGVYVTVFNISDCIALLEKRI